MYYSNDSHPTYSTLIGAEIMLENGAKRSLTVEDNFAIYYDWDKFNQLSYFERENINAINDIPEQDWTGWRHCNRAAYKVENGVVYGYSHYKGYANSVTLMQYDAVKQEATYLSFFPSSHVYWNTGSLEEHGILIEFHDNNLYYYADVWEAYKEACVSYDEKIGFFTSNSTSLSDYESFTPNLVLENCSLDGVKDAIMAYGVNGNIYYDIVVFI